MLATLRFRASKPSAEGFRPPLAARLTSSASPADRGLSLVELDHGLDFLRMGGHSATQRRRQGRLRRFSFLFGLGLSSARQSEGHPPNRA
jgi:hypothetical protein